MIVLGIDPGLDGACAVLADDGRVDLLDTPTLLITGGRKTKREHNMEAVSAWLRDATEVIGADGDAVPVVAYLEYVRGIPNIRGRRQGASSIWAQGYGVGCWEGVLAGLGIPRVRVSPQRWKRVMMDGHGKGKDASRMVALQRYPRLADQLKRKKDVGRADALLIATYGAQQERAPGGPTVKGA